MSVVENLEMGAYAVSDKVQVRRTMEQVFQIFPRLGERPKQAAGTMSGGEQQMLAMGRALMVEPRVVLMDEPSLGLAPRFVELVFEKIGELKAGGMTLLLVEQNAVKSLSISDRGYVLELGRNRFTGPRGRPPRRRAGAEAVPGGMRHGSPQQPVGRRIANARRVGRRGDGEQRPRRDRPGRWRWGRQSTVHTRSP